MVLKTISPGCGVWASLMLFYTLHLIIIESHAGHEKVKKKLSLKTLVKLLKEHS